MGMAVHIDRQRNKTIDGVTFTNTHSGQKKAYGDSFYEYDVASDLPAAEVEKVCAIPESQYLAELRANHSMDNAFRASYKFTRVGEGKYRYVVSYPYAD
jgi:hypothetical protein